MNTKATWRQRAERLAALLPPERLQPAVLGWVAASRRVRRPWLVAFSGGADSLALLLLLWAHWPERRPALQAVHFNHRLRGRAAKADEDFCRRVCAALGVRFRAGAWRDAPKNASEAAARAARHGFFAAEFGRTRAAALWLGHQQDDIAETMLMRLARGSGTSGLAAPRPVQVMPGGRVHLRPLLTLKKAEIAASLRAAKIPWRDDATNATRDFLRNRMRHDVVPVWQSVSGTRDVAQGAALARDLLEEDDVALEQWLREISPALKDGSLSLRRLAGKPRALVRRALRGWLANCAGEVELSRQAFELLLTDLAVQRSTQHSLGAAGFAVIRRGRLFLRSRTVPRKTTDGFHEPVN